MSQTQVDRPSWDIDDDEVVHILCDCQFDGFGYPMIPATRMCGGKDDEPEIVDGEHTNVDCPMCWVAQSCPACGE